MGLLIGLILLNAQYIPKLRIYKILRLKHSSLFVVLLISFRKYTYSVLNLTFIGPCIANIFAEYNQQDATFHNLFISVRRCACFRRVFRPSSGAQNCTYSVRYLSDHYCYLLLAWPASSRNKQIVKRCILLVALCECIYSRRWFLASQPYMVS